MKWNIVRKLSLAALGWCQVGLIITILAGCSHSNTSAVRAGSTRGLLPPEPPSFLSGPVAVLLTNTDSFGGHIVVDSGNRMKVVSGELLGRDGKLLFAPDPTAK